MKKIRQVNMQESCDSVFTRSFFSGGSSRNAPALMRGNSSMTKKNGFTERRKLNRFKARSGAFAIVRAATAAFCQIKDMSMGEIAFSIITAKPLLMGQIANISSARLAFHYIDNGKEATESYVLDILLAQDAFYLKDVPFKAITDFDEVSEVLYSPIRIKQQCIQFGKLSPEQTYQLDYFVKNYTKNLF